MARPKDISKLSTKPSQIRNRLRRKERAYDDDIRLYADHAYGHPLDEWDYEELARGKPRNAKGDFRGRPPAWITPAIQKEAKRRLLDQTYGQLAGHVELAVQTMANLLNSDEVDEKGKPYVDAKTKLAAAAFIIEHVIGKPKAIIEVTGDETVRASLVRTFVLPDGAAKHYGAVVEGEIVEDDDDEEEEVPDGNEPG